MRRLVRHHRSILARELARYPTYRPELATDINNARMRLTKITFHITLKLEEISLNILPACCEVREV